jgi:hypothetical protein
MRSGPSSWDMRVFDPSKKNVLQVIKTVASRLGNTPAIGCKCYVNPVIIKAYFGGIATADAALNRESGAYVPAPWVVFPGVDPPAIFLTNLCLRDQG